MSEEFHGGRSVFGVDLQATEGKVLESWVRKLRHGRWPSGLTNLEKKEEENAINSIQYSRDAELKLVIGVNEQYWL